MFDLSGKTALVTGAGQSVGAGIVQALASQGAVVVVNDVVAERAASTVAAIAAHGGRATASIFDVTDPDAVERAVAQLGPIDILVNNAGNAGEHTFAPKPFIEMAASEYERFLDVNLHGVLHCTRAVLAGMYERGRGRVITISSGAGLAGNRMGISIYGAAKGGAIAFMRHLAIESASQGVTANTLALGLMERNAGSTSNAASTVTAQLARSIPVGRLGTPADVGAACVWLASDEASWVTGKTITLDGGSLPT